MKLVLGPPGTGKTTKLISIMEEAISKGIDPTKIAFISFTKRAIKEARSRVKLKFNFNNEQVNNFRTLHSFAFKYLGLSSKNLMKKANYAELSEILGIALSGVDTRVEEDNIEAPNYEEGDRLLFIDGIARNKLMSIKEAWEDCSGYDLDFFEVERVHIALKQYKRQVNLLDYTDLLERYLVEDIQVPLDLLLVDEAQDLSLLQWKVIEKLKTRAKKIYIAGDDDQAIFKWAGAEVEHFIRLEGEVEVLNQSYRLPKEVHTYAQTILNTISLRRDKPFNCAPHPGSVSYLDNLDDLDLSKDTWLILARSAYNLYPYIHIARESGLFFNFRDKGPNMSGLCRAIQTYKLLQKGPVEPYKLRHMDNYLLRSFNKELPWQDALGNAPDSQMDYYRMLEESGEDLGSQPRVLFSTIHGSKGAEADNVVICPDLSYKAYKEMIDHPDDEARVFYVGVTRAKKNLYILQPQTRYYYEL